MDGQEPYVITALIGAVSVLFGMLTRYVMRLEKENQTYRDAAQKALDAYQDREKEEAAWRRERLRRLEEQSRSSPERSSSS